MVEFQFLIGRLITESKKIKRRQKNVFQFLIGRLITRDWKHWGNCVALVSIPHR